ncbi:hypothetical protein ACFX11_030907 [Malus domestica]
MDKAGKIRFQADNDSEISKGFCSCLIWMLDGAKAGEFLAVETRDLQDVNVWVVRKGEFESKHVAQRAASDAEEDSSFGYGAKAGDTGNNDSAKNCLVYFLGARDQK